MTVVLLWDSGGDGDMAMVGDNEEEFQSFRMLEEQAPQEVNQTHESLLPAVMITKMPLC